MTKKLSTIFDNAKYYCIFKQYKSNRVAGTTRDFRTIKLLNKNGILTGFFELFCFYICEPMGARKSTKLVFF